MCANELCPNAAHCYRVQAPQSSDWQSVGIYDYTVSIRGVECDGYWPIYRSTASDSTTPNVQLNGAREPATTK